LFWEPLKKRFDLSKPASVLTSKYFPNLPENRKQPVPCRSPLQVSLRMLMAGSIPGPCRRRLLDPVFGAMLSLETPRAVAAS